MVNDFIRLLKENGEGWVKYPSSHRRNGQTAHYILKRGGTMAIRFDFNNIEYDICQIEDKKDVARELELTGKERFLTKPQWK